jgi:hypothetical protein
MPAGKWHKRSNSYPMNDESPSDRETRSEIAQNLAETLLAFGEPSAVRQLERDLENAGLKVSLPEKDEEELASVLETVLEDYPELVSLERYREVTEDKGEWALEAITSSLSTTGSD